MDVASQKGAGVIGARVSRLLRSVQRARALATALMALGWSFALFAALAGGVIALDAVRPLPPEARRIAGVLAAALAVGALVFALAAGRRGRQISVAALAARYGERLALAAGLLPSLAAGQRDLGGALAARAVQRGDARAAQASGWSAAAWRRAGIAWGVALTALLLAGLAAQTDAGARALAFAAPRFLDPAGDHPPFTWVDFEISLDPEAPLVGDDVRIRVRTAGASVEELALVLREEASGREIARRRMRIVDRDQPAGAIVWSTTLADVRRPLRAHAAAAAGRSASVVIDPTDRPRVRAAWIEIAPAGEGEALPLNPGRERAVTAPVGARVDVVAQTTTELASAEAEGAGEGWPVEATISGRGARISIAIQRPGEAGVVVDVKSRAGLGLEERLYVRIRGVVPARGGDGEGVAADSGAATSDGAEAGAPAESAGGDERARASAADGGGGGQKSDAGEEAGERGEEDRSGASERGAGRGGGGVREQGRRGDGEGSWRRVVPREGSGSRRLTADVKDRWEGRIGPIDAPGAVSELAARYFEAVARWWERDDNPPSENHP